MPSDIRWVTLPLGCPLNPSKSKRGQLRSASCHRPRFNSSAMMSSASAYAPIRSLICVSKSSRNLSSPRHQPRLIGLNSSPSSVPRRSFTYQYQELTPFKNDALLYWETVHTVIHTRT
jgi:hypothetical protein